MRYRVFVTVDKEFVIEAESERDAAEIALEDLGKEAVCFVHAEPEEEEKAA